jgi:signal transduction histidine kinase
VETRIGLWATQQLAEFLAALFEAEDEAAVLRAGVERAAETMEAEIGAALIEGMVEVSRGFRPGREPITLLNWAAAVARAEMEVPDLGVCFTAAVDIERHDESAGRLVLGRSSTPFSAVEMGLLRNMARVLALALRSARTVAGDRLLLASIQERKELLERLTRIVRSISHRAPLEDVFDAICVGACELVGNSVALIRRLDESRPGMLRVVSSHGFSDYEIEEVEWLEVGQGAGGRAFAEERMVVIDDYSDKPGVVEHFQKRDLQCALALPVYEGDRVVGTLTIGSYEAGRTYSPAEQDAMAALAEHASLALSDARLLQQMREAQAAKDLFLAMVSHELKTPLTVMMGMLRTLETRDEDVSPEERKAMLSAAYRRGQELLGLIDRLLQGAKGELASTVTNALLTDVVNDALDGLHHLGRVARRKVAEVTVTTDPQAARAVLGVLIENAIAHSPPDTPIEVSGHADMGEAVLSVRNRGLLPPELSVTELFAPFRRGSDATSPGVGLGLYIAARLTASMGASLNCVQEGDQVCFRLRLPLAEARQTSTSA